MNDPNIIAEWDDDMTYLYVDYPYYKKYIIFAPISTVSSTFIYYHDIVPVLVQL